MPVSRTVVVVENESLLRDAPTRKTSRAK
jgi:hypothetical protein